MRLSCLKTLLIVLAMSSGLCVPGLRAADMRNDVWSIHIDPATLAVEASPGGGEKVSLSAAQKDFGAVADLKEDATSVVWRLREAGVNVMCRLSGPELHVEFTADKPGKLIWPIIAGQPVVKAWILPRAEGIYVPADDADWPTFLADQGPLNTMADLSMPFIGLDCGGRTITYLFDNPYNNELGFAAALPLSATLTHEFTRNHKTHTTAYTIRLGGPSPIEPAKQYRQWLIDRKQFVSLTEKAKQTPNVARLFGAMHAYVWGDGVSTEFLDKLKQNGIDRALLCLGDLNTANEKPEVATKANELGYLFGPYDSYHSIHSPKTKDTWVTAQFDQDLYDHGGIVKADGTKKTGFQKKGYNLSSLAVRPYVERRVNELIAKVSFTAWFIDCDATGELFDNYSEEFPATMAEDAAERLSRMAWINQKHGVVIGSEGGNGFASPVIHFAHGMMTPVIGWGDPDLKDRKSPYWLGPYWPPEGPGIFTRQAKLKPFYQKFFFDPRFRLPLYQAALHDSVVATHQWGYGSLKFSDQVVTDELLELLYNVPPLYHLNLKEYKKHAKRILAHYAIFSPSHRALAEHPMVAFQWLTEDRLVQRTAFANGGEIVANFGDVPFAREGVTLPARSVMLRDAGNSPPRIYTPAVVP